MEKLPEMGSRQSLIESSQSYNDRKAHATKCAKIILGCFRTGDANDPEVYVTSVVAILAGYPTDVMERVCSPINGLPARLKWLPTLAEIRQACEDIEGPRRRMREWDEAAKQQLDDRVREDVARAKRPTYDELRAKYDGPNGEKWGIGDPTKAQKSRDQLRAELAAKIGQEAFDAIPDVEPQAQQFRAFTDDELRERFGGRE